MADSLSNKRHAQAFPLATAGIQHNGCPEWQFKFKLDCYVSRRVQVVKDHCDTHNWLISWLRHFSHGYTKYHSNCCKCVDQCHQLFSSTTTTRNTLDSWSTVKCPLRHTSRKFDRIGLFDPKDSFWRNNTSYPSTIAIDDYHEPNARSNAVCHRYTYHHRNRYNRYSTKRWQHWIVFYRTITKDDEIWYFCSSTNRLDYNTAHRSRYTLSDRWIKWGMSDRSSVGNWHRSCFYRYCTRLRTKRYTNTCGSTEIKYLPGLQEVTNTVRTTCSYSHRRQRLLLGLFSFVLVLSVRIIFSPYKYSA